MKRALCYYGNPLLRKKCAPVEKITDEIRSFVKDMIETMDSRNGVGLAANQVGKLLQIIVIRPIKKDDNGEVVLGEAEVYINPELSNPSEQTEILSEGCLSFPNFHLDIERPYKIHVEAIDLDGKPISEDVLGFKARELMHENDHLHGRFFIDRVQDDKLRKQIEPILKKMKAKYS